MRVGLDLDGCAYPFVEDFTAYVCRRLHVSSLPMASAWDFHTSQWGLNQNQMLELMKDAVLEGALWKQGAPEVGFAKATWDLQTAGHTVVICTDKNVPGVELEAQELTRTWLRDVGAIYDELLFSADKSVAGTDVFIDDRPGTVPTLRMAGVDAVYFDRPWNHSYPYPRIYSWAGFVEFVARKEEHEHTSIQTW